LADTWSTAYRNCPGSTSTALLPICSTDASAPTTADLGMTMLVRTGALPNPS
jgi:hypothetical protein